MFLWLIYMKNFSCTVCGWDEILKRNKQCRKTIRKGVVVSEQKQFKIVTLNVAHGRFLEQSAAFLQTCRADVLCLQDVQKCHLMALTPSDYHVVFESTGRYSSDHGGHTLAGIAIASRFPLISKEVHAYSGDVQPVPHIAGVKISENGIVTAEERSPSVTSESGLILAVGIKVGGWTTKICTVRDTWSNCNEVKGALSIRALASTIRCITKIDQGLILAGNFNFDSAVRRNFHWALVRLCGLEDCLPHNVDSTLDPANHPNKDAQNLISEHVFRFDQDVIITIPKVFAHFGVSERAALSAVVNLR